MCYVSECVCVCVCIQGAVEYSWKLLSTEPPENRDQVFMSVRSNHKTSSLNEDH